MQYIQQKTDALYQKDTTDYTGTYRSMYYTNI